MAAGRNDQTDPGGPMPTSGTSRPGPMRPLYLPPPPTGTKPVALKLARLGISAAIEVSEFDGDRPFPPSAPDLLAWYRRSPLLGLPGVILIGGLTGIGETGPSAFTRLSEVKPGDRVDLTGANGGGFRYEIDHVEAETAPPDFAALLADRSEERLMLIGWDGPFPPSIGFGAVDIATGRRV